jgi:hypothetical protein
MQDQPTPAEILAAVAGFLRADISADITPHAVFQARVAANALEIARRDLELGPAADAEELGRLQRLLGRAGSLLDLNRTLAQRIAEGEFTLETPGLAEHLWKTTLDKLAVDQPSYSGYRAALIERNSIKPDIEEA